MAQVGTCVACEVTNVRVATATAECACQVCEHCAELFMADGACGVCGAALSADDLEEEDDKGQAPVAAWGQCSAPPVATSSLQAEGSKPLA